MVLYICNKCNKNFTRKQCYDVHINRKIPCIPENNINKIINLEDNTKYLEENIKKLEKINKQYEEKNKQYEEKNKQYEEKIKELENDKDILKEENFTMKVQIKEKQDLLNNKDIEIKDLYKNMNVKKNNNDDIKIKLVQEYVYIIRECDFVRLNEDIYKIGRTSKTNPEDRFQKYRSKANYENEVFIISRN